MNVKDVEETMDGTNQDRLVLIFNRQRELMEKYHHIEKNLRLTPDCPVSLHDSKGQLLLKDFAWRTTEELAEAIDAIENGESEEHIKEEVADALHFLVEMGILSNITPDILLTLDPDELPPHDYLETLFSLWTYENKLNYSEAFTQFIVRLGMVCHTLKNKPWKQTQMLTDIKEYTTRYIETFHYFIRFCISIDLQPEELFQLYFKKSKVNAFRIRSSY